MFNKKFQVLVSALLIGGSAIGGISPALATSTPKETKAVLYDESGNEICMDSVATIAYGFSSNSVRTSRQLRLEKYTKMHKREALITHFSSVDEAVDYELTKKNAVWFSMPGDWNTEFKAWESYTANTDRTAPQYDFLYGDSAWTDTSNGIRCNGNRYCIALGSGFGSREVGTKYDVILYNGNVLHCVLGDVKQDRDTVGIHMQCPNGSVIEFITDPAVFSYLKDASGTVNFADGFDGKIRNIIRIDE